MAPIEIEWEALTNACDMLREDREEGDFPISTHNLKVAILTYMENSSQVHEWRQKAWMYEELCK